MSYRDVNGLTIRRSLKILLKEVVKNVKINFKVIDIYNLTLLSVKLI